ncbi:hypothetical protein [Flavimarina sp. Hel_I_48]|uniref:hypothetical protein n=1 Tax=Flavimarina sp. Hel_I_48 TaxID=1392488 RepID=UPI0004DF2213|nr:hypothetical protein [Flavimarina sp. Hel_I_48]
MDIPLKKITLFFSILIATILIGCGATPGISTGSKEPDKNFPSYHYQDAEGNLYDITSQKFIYTPVSATNTIDGITDEGLYMELNISLNEYAKIAAACEAQLQRNQNPLTERSPDIPLPFLRRKGDNTPKKINIDYTAVNALNFILEPFLDE